MCVCECLFTHLYLCVNVCLRIYICVWMFVYAFISVCECVSFLCNSIFPIHFNFQTKDLQIKDQRQHLSTLHHQHTKLREDHASVTAEKEKALSEAAASQKEKERAEALAADLKIENERFESLLRANEVKFTELEKEMAALKKSHMDQMAMYIAQIEQVKADGVVFFLICFGYIFG